MTRAVNNIERKEGIRGLNPQLFSLWVGMASIIMLFGAFTSAYIVKQSAGNWLEFAIPMEFYISTALILCSSVTLHLSFGAYNNGEEKKYKSLLILSLGLGIGFIILQYIGWQQLFNMGVDLKINASGSFFYLITGAHAAHVLGGIAALIVAVLHAYTLKFEVKENRINRFRLTAHYWHFVDVLWIYLLIFLLIIK